MTKAEMRPRPLPKHVTLAEVLVLLKAMQNLGMDLGVDYGCDFRPLALRLSEDINRTLIEGENNAVGRQGQ